MIAGALKAKCEIAVDGVERPIRLHHALSSRQIDILQAGGAINWRRARHTQSQG